jgi:fructose-1,6-bisphosphatase I
MPNSPLSLQDFLRDDASSGGVADDLISVLDDIANACRDIADHVRKGAFSDNLGATEDTNVQGETQKQLDVIANDEFVAHCSKNPRIAALVSEEVDEIYWIKDTPEANDFIVYFDPLDGSSNLDVNLSVGSIFSIVRADTALDPSDDTAVRRKGVEQICAGYAIYGPSTSFVITTLNGVNGFTHDLASDAFYLTFPNMTVPPQTGEFAINASRYQKWEAPVQKYFDDCIAGKDGPLGKTYNMRWTASMVADIHRILTRGGVFLYPVDSGNRANGGKLRLMYEANPMGLLVEQAGGAASTGRGKIMEVAPTGHHQRVSVIMGSKDEVAVIDGYHKDHG